MRTKKGQKAAYKNYVAINSKDEYAKAIIDASEAVGSALDEGKTPEEAERAMHGHDLTGFMAGAVAYTINRFHPRGQEFNDYWNGQYGLPKGRKGTVNPAIMTIGPK